ncbi:MAG TPA: response regulator [Solirubrobacteraceae bacterium]|nr:response regulator [Solirubrobacteraceae bacterium]
MRPRSLTGIVVGLFGVTAVIVGGIFAVLLISLVNLRQSDRSVRTSSDLLAQSLAAARTVVDVQTALSRFLVTREVGLLQRYNQTQAELPAELGKLRSLARDPGEQQLISQISTGVNSYVSDYARPLADSRARLSSAQELRDTSRGDDLVDALQGGFDQLEARSLALSEKQRRSANDAASSAILVAAIGAAASLLLLLAVAAYLIMRVLRPIRSVSKAAERLAGGELDVGVPEVGLGEVARLGRSFNEMTRAIKHRDGELMAAQTELERAAAAAEEASAMKSNFLANMSHETRTPLNGVVGMLSLLSDTPLTAEQREYVDVAKTSSDALMMVVNDILDIAKIEAGRLEVERRDFDLYDIVEASCDMVAATALSKGIELQSFVHDDVPRAVCGDRMRVGQILANLLSNAVKFTPEGEVVLEVSLAEQTDQTIRIRFEVRDSGIGIAPERIADLFEPFTQAEAGTTRKFGGTGLGLAISLELTHLMGGNLDAESELGRGSTFRFEIPFAPARAQLRAPVPAAELRGLHVLVVDDNPTNRQVFEAYVASWGMRPVVARDGVEALAELERAARSNDPFDVALLDLNMPAMNGLELARRISASPSLRHTHLILLTSSLQLDANEPSSAISYHLTKPVRQSRLLDAISAAMAIDLEGEREPTPARPARGRSSASRRPGARILVAEDQPVNWMLIERMLAKSGYVAANAVDGRQVLEMLESRHYDLLFMDVHMPVLDGYATAREIRRREALRRRRQAPPTNLIAHEDPLPIVAMTANAMSGDRERCLAAGMSDYMAKPISTEVLDEMLARWLPSAVSEEGSVLDEGRLSELRSLFPGEEMSGVLRDLKADVTAELERVGTAVTDSDPVVLASAAHRIKNSADMIGAHGLADAATLIESRARVEESSADSIDETAVAALRVQWTVVEAAIEAELAQQVGSG